MYIKSVTVHYVNPIASSLVCICVLPWWRLNLANWKRFCVLLLHGPLNVILLFVRVRQNLDASALRDADFRNLFRVSCVRDCGLRQEIFWFLTQWIVSWLQFAVIHLPDNKGKKLEEPVCWYTLENCLKKKLGWHLRLLLSKRCAMMSLKKEGPIASQRSVWWGALHLLKEGQIQLQ